MKTAAFAAALALAFPFASCRSDDPVEARKAAVRKLYESGSAKIAVANSFEANKSKMWEGVLLAKERIEEEGLCPVSLEIVRCEDGGTTVSGTQKAYEIASDDEVCAVVGHGYSDITLPCSQIYQYHGILLFNFISTIHTLTDRNNPLIFSNMPNDATFGGAIARLCERNGYKRVFIYDQENASGTSLSNAFELNCNKYGISVANRESYESSTEAQEFSRHIRRWKNNFVFDAIFVAGRMPSIRTIIGEIRANGLDCPVVGADPFDDPLLAGALDQSENGRLFAVSNYDEQSENPEFVKFIESFREKFGEEPDQEALQAYDAVMVLAKAIGKARSAVPGEIAAALRSGTWNEAAGPYRFQQDGDSTGRRLTAKVFQDGRFVNIK